ncbi:MAG: DUF4326 domain-containing protein [Flavobacteriales bacterium]|nr:DUF4326 domain-containing protein [Flavobacteriales bacterium]
MPERIQRRRIKGWRMPENAVYVGRPTRWGNPFVVGDHYWEFDSSGNLVHVRDRAHAVALFRERCDWRTGSGDDSPSAAEELRGKDLVCWCPLVDENGNKVPCHADVLLEWANAEMPR